MPCTRIVLLVLVLTSLGCETVPSNRGNAPASSATSEPANTESEPGMAAEPGAASQPTPAPEPTAAAQPALANAAATAELGKPAPEFTLEGVDGKPHALADLRGKVVVLEWFNPDCPFVRHAHGKGPLVDLAKKSVNDKVVWLSINSGGEGKQGHGLERNRAALTEYGIVNPVLLDPTGAVGKAYGAQRTPHLFVVDAQGLLVYRGGLDNAPMGTVDATRPRYADSAEGAVVDYVTGALSDLQATHELRLADTPAYGCSVKYGDG